MRGFGAVGISERLFCEGRVRLESPNEFMLSFDAARFRRQQLPACSASTAEFFHFLSAAASLSGSDVIVACVLRRAAFVRCCLLRGSEVRLASNQLDFRSSSHIPQLLMTFQTKTETESSTSSFRLSSKFVTWVLQVSSSCPLNPALLSDIVPSSEDTPRYCSREQCRENTCKCVYSICSRDSLPIPG